jgi:hypothetical protein
MCRRLTALLVVASSLAVAATAGAGGSGLRALILRPSQVGPGYRLQERPDGNGVRGLVTLDMCGYDFRSESLRTARLQVDYVAHGKPHVSNEVVRYRPGGVTQAFREIMQAWRTCPRGPVPSRIQGVPALTYRITSFVDRRIPAGTIPLVVRMTGKWKGKTVTVTIVSIYHREGNVLSGVYVQGGTLREARQVAVRASVASAADLERG